MKCKEIMTENPKCINASAGAPEAARIMKEEDVGSVPVLDDQTRKLVGIVTDRDLCLRIVAEERNPREVKVSECMTPNPVTCLPEDDVQKAEALMKEHKVRRIPVVDENHFCAGIIAQADLALEVKKPEEVSEVVEKISEPPGQKPGRIKAA